MVRFCSVLILLLCTLVLNPGLIAQENTDPERWEEDIQAFEEKDKTDPPPKGGILFVGSSSIRKWVLEESFPGLNAINRGFGGSHMEDCLYYTDRIVIPYEPKIIVLYEGDNDIASGKTPQKVFNDYKAFVKKVHKTLPDTHIAFIAIKPSIKRWEKVETMRETNSLIRDFNKKDCRLTYFDIDFPMIGENGQPRPDIFVDDGLHLNKKGYRLWTTIIKPSLQILRCIKKA